MGEVIDDANRDGHRAYPWLFSWLVENFHVGFVWNRGDRGVDYWFPQGITGTADAYDSGQLGGRKIVLVSWYYKEGVSSIDKGVRVSFAEVTDISDVDYRHSLLVDPYWRDGYPDFKAVPIHAGGIVWYDPYLYVADTHGGLRVFDMNHIFKVATDSDRIGRSSTGQYHAYRYKYVIPQIGTYRACTNNMKFSFVSLDRSSSPHSLISGEYEKKSIQGKLLRWPLDEMTSRLEESPSGDIRPTEAYVSSRRRMQGALAWEDEYWLSCSSQRELIPGLPFRVGSLYRTGVGTPSEECVWIDGPEDLHYAPQSGNLWSLTEHIGKRLVFALKPENCPSFLW